MQSHTPDKLAPLARTKLRRLRRPTTAAPHQVANSPVRPSSCRASSKCRCKDAVRAKMATKQRHVDPTGGGRHVALA
eukprot:12879927-Prorocentrum_lima.AAC.1